MLPDQILTAVSRNVSIGDGSKSLLTHPPLAASHQMPTSRSGPTASSTARRVPLVFSFEIALRMSAPAFSPERGSSRLCGLAPFLQAYLCPTGSKGNAELCNQLCIFTC